MQKKRFEEALQDLIIVKLQAEIEFLEEHVIVGDRLVYNAGLGREKELPRLDKEIEELRKMIYMDVEC